MSAAQLSPLFAVKKLKMFDPAEEGNGASGGWAPSVSVTGQFSPLRRSGYYCPVGLLVTGHLGIWLRVNGFLL